MTSPIVLPRLRQELRLLPGQVTNDGAPTWLIHDPVRHRYFSISYEIVDLLRLWTEKGDQALLDYVENSEEKEDYQRRLKSLVFFLHANNLTIDPPEDDYRAFVAQTEAMQKSPFQQALHGYLFFRVPLFRPHKFLKRTVHLVEPLFSWQFLSTLAFLGVFGLYFVSREWDQFQATFLHFFSLQGLAIYGLSLIFVKTLHELGHAYMAARLGVRVNTMGVAFMVMLPLLYTDVSDSWRLRSKKQKLLIDSAGIFVELSIALIATFLWVFLPEGPFKSAAFVLATTSWILSLAINLNPFMRFDGYYILADAWGISNLQARSFAFAKWWLRELLFDLRQLPPEPMLKRTQNFLIAYAIGVWLYRFFLFLGLALLVYFMFFKVLGVLLFVVEIYWFILRPILGEFKVWWDIKREIANHRRAFISAGGLIAAVVLMFVPLDKTVRVPAVMSATEENIVYPPYPAYIKISHLKDGMLVNEGMPLVVLKSPELDHKQQQVQRRVKLLKARIARLVGDPKELESLLVLKQQLQARKEEAKGLRRELAKLVVRAPMDGVLRDLNSEIHEGRWVDPKTEMAMIVTGPTIAMKAKGLVDEQDLWRLKVGSGGVFIADNPVLSSRDVRLNSVAYSGTQNLDIPYLASVYGGPVAVEEDEEKSLRPVTSSYLATFSSDDAVYQKATRGVVHLKGQSESLAHAIWRQVFRIFVREVGI